PEHPDGRERQALDVLQHDDGRHRLAHVELPRGQRLGGGERSVAPGDVNVEAALLPEAAVAGDEGMDERALGDPGQGEANLGQWLGHGASGTALQHETTACGRDHGPARISQELSAADSSPHRSPPGRFRGRPQAAAVMTGGTRGESDLYATPSRSAKSGRTRSPRCSSAPLASRTVPSPPSRRTTETSAPPPPPNAPIWPPRPRRPAAFDVHMLIASTSGTPRASSSLIAWWRLNVAVSCSALRFGRLAGDAVTASVVTRLTA